MLKVLILFFGFSCAVSTNNYRAFLNITQIDLSGHDCDWTSSCDINFSVCVLDLQPFSFIKQFCHDSSEYEELTENNDIWNGSITRTFFIENFNKKSAMYFSISDEDPGINDKMVTFIINLFTRKEKTKIPLEKSIKGYIELTKLT